MPSIKATCPECSAVLFLGHDSAVGEIACPECDHRFYVDDAELGRVRPRPPKRPVRPGTSAPVEVRALSPASPPPGYSASELASLSERRIKKKPFIITELAPLPT